MVVLLVIFLLQNHMESGFIASDISVDDWRYEEGGMYYATHANFLFDKEAFKIAFGRLGDRTGYETEILKILFRSTPFWYWLVCFVIYITKTYWAVRILNIVISSFSSIYIYRFANLIYGKKTAKLSTKLYSFLPYPVIFSCFSYKDHLVLLCTFYLFYVSTKFRFREKVLKIEILNALLLFFVLLFTRSGLSPILLFLCFCIIFIKETKLKKIFKIKYFILAVFGLVLLYFFKEPIIHKFSAYLSENVATQEAGNTISIVTITKITEIYKLPLTYMFSVIQPIGIGNFHNSWASVVSNINIIMIPIAIGGGIYVFKSKKIDKLLFLMLAGYYSISIIMSIGIFRHYYSVLPLSFIIFAELVTKGKRIDFLLLSLGTLFGIFIILSYYILIRG
nr:hypothetical protein [Fusobacterium necrophorum]